MNKLLTYLRLLLLTVFCVSAINCGNAYNLRQTTNADGLTNSAILSMSRDDSGLLWIGTCDGVNIFDGNSVVPFAQAFPGLSLTGNIIESLYASGGGRQWVQTNYALNLLDLNVSRSKAFPQFKGQERMCVNKRGDFFIYGEDGVLYVYSSPGTEGDFERVADIGHGLMQLRAMQVTDTELIIVTNSGQFVYPLEFENGKYNIGKGGCRLKRDIRFATVDSGDLLAIDTDSRLVKIDSDGRITPVLDLDDVIRRHNSVSDIVRARNGDIFISFSTGGVVRARHEGMNYKISDLGLRVGVFCLEKSEQQDVVWIGSDCQGLYTYHDSQYSVRTIDFAMLGNIISHPVRALWIDRDNTLWVGTKGDGLMRIDNFDTHDPDYGHNAPQLYTASNCELRNNSVFGFAPGSRNMLWIGTETGINYYSYTDRRLHRLETPVDINYVHGVCEDNDSTLWAVTVGEGVYRITLAPGAAATVKDVRRYTIDGGKFSSNYFFRLTRTPDGRMLFGNRGFGIYEIKEGELKAVALNGDYDNRTLRDVFTIYADQSTIWAGTGHGLAKHSADGKEAFFGTDNGFVNTTIHDMGADSDGYLWLSTNKGLLRFNPASDQAQVYGSNAGVGVSEFSDGAFFGNSDAILFGGINGIVMIHKNRGYEADAPFAPDLILTQLNISGRSVPVSDYSDGRGGVSSLSLSHTQNHFSVTFSARDYINAADYTYYYTLDGKEWISNGNNPTITFTQMDYGTYHLEVKYVNRATGVEGANTELTINIRAPWYLSGWAKGGYVLLAMICMALGWRAYERRQRRRHADEMERVSRAHREEVYEEKLRFFTNITHEFCTPLTLIYGPCERLMNYEGSDDYVKKYVGLVRNNTERLNTLIQELIDFRRIETGHKQLTLRPVEVGELCADIADSFGELAERNRIDYRREIESDVSWVSDYSGLRKVVTNLVSNAFKYTPEGGTINIGLRMAGDNLEISVYNTGKGIRPEDRERIFNRYSVLDNVEENAIKGLSSRNGLGMAICHSVVEMLHGTIEIESEVGSYARFVVRLPRLEATAVAAAPGASESFYLKVNGAERSDAIAAVPPKEAGGAGPVAYDSRETLPTVLVIDDNHEILTLLQESLSEYNVETADDADKGLEILKKHTPDIIITDVMMPGTDGMALAKLIKSHSHTTHVPLIILSAKTSNEERVAGLEAGADAYVGKPFSLAYLKAVMRRLLESRKGLKEYFNSSASAFDYSGGRLMSSEDRAFIKSITDFIDSRIDDLELSPESLAEHMQISLRALYRRFKDLELTTPKDFIKNQRLTHAAKLLVTTSRTVQEVIYDSGFNNRTHFYREFDKRYGCTPREYRDSNRKPDAAITTASGSQAAE